MVANSALREKRANEEILSCFVVKTLLKMWHNRSFLTRTSKGSYAAQLCSYPGSNILIVNVSCVLFVLVVVAENMSGAAMYELVRGAQRARSVCVIHKSSSLLVLAVATPGSQ